MKNDNLLEVSAITGNLTVTNEQGLILASVLPGHSVSVAMMPRAASPSKELGANFSATGLVSQENGHFYLETVDGTKYEIAGRDLHKFVGMKVQVTGTLEGNSDSRKIAVGSILRNGAVGIGTAESLLIVGGIAGAGAGIGYGIYRGTQSASR